MIMLMPSKHSSRPVQCLGGGRRSNGRLPGSAERGGPDVVMESKEKTGSFSLSNVTRSL
jgi:hypothetical protein